MGSSSLVIHHRKCLKSKAMKKKELQHQSKSRLTYTSSFFFELLISPCIFIAPITVGRTLCNYFDKQWYQHFGFQSLSSISDSEKQQKLIPEALDSSDRSGELIQQSSFSCISPQPNFLGQVPTGSGNLDRCNKNKSHIMLTFLPGRLFFLSPRLKIYF